MHAAFSTLARPSLRAVARNLPHQCRSTEAQGRAGAMWREQGRRHFASAMPDSAAADAGGAGRWPWRPRRSVLYVPGSNERALAKVAGVAADGLILDLEDAVAPASKEAARARVAGVLRGGEFGGKEVTVRVNPLTSQWGWGDVEAVAALGADALVLPMVQSREEVQQLSDVMDACGAPARSAIWVMVETPRGVLNTFDIASHPRVACVVAGTTDLAHDLRARHVPGRAPLLTSLGMIVLGARAAGAAVLDGVALDLGDDAAFDAACEQARDMGFDGKTLIHPKTIAAANAAFAPTPDELEEAREIVEAFEQAEAEGRGVVVVRGRLIEHMHATEARALLSVAASLEGR